MRNIKKLLLILTAAAALLCGCVDMTAYDTEDSGSEGNGREASQSLREEGGGDGENGGEDKDKSGEGLLTLHFIDVGQGDCTFAELPNGETLLIDAGETDMGQEAVTYIQECGYDTIDYAVCTHPHSDHIGGMIDAANFLNVKSAYLSQADSDTDVYADLLFSLEECGADVQRANVGDVILSDEELCVDIIAPAEGFDWGDNLNNASLIVRITHGENVVLVTGDAEREETLAVAPEELDCDLLRCAHHGSENGTYEELLQAASPQYAVISCGMNNPYGHPHDEAIELLNAYGVEIFRTDMQGDLTFVSDGKTLTTAAAPYEAATQSGVEGEGESVESSESEVIYILNTNTKKIHFADCRAVNSIKEENKGQTDNLEAALAEGYEPCAICNPH